MAEVLQQEGEINTFDGIDKPVKQRKTPKKRMRNELDTKRHKMKVGLTFTAELLRISSATLFSKQNKQPSPWKLQNSTSRPSPAGVATTAAENAPADTIYPATSAFLSTAPTIFFLSSILVKALTRYPYP
ncbi:hypothetical protein RRG08_029436 [Elysia crispata]|uniref:Uncharacterized protein n=1 Tax=Elysia crispata TaxID=231223 RepID=A0AAE1BCM9_9GAST|nr:hypothetical protein RRG08_029436 [Elysia crispata]